MITNCPVCGKAFDILYPDLWRYRRSHMHNRLFLCSWGCLRQYDKGKEEEKTMAMMKKDGTPAKKPGPKPKKKIETPEKKAPEKIETPEDIIELTSGPDLVAKLPADEGLPEVETNGFVLPAFINGFEIVGIKGQFGIYRASSEHNYFEFDPYGGDLCMNPGEWREQIDELNRAAKVLGVKL